VPSAIVMQGDARDLPFPDESVDLIVTSPPYFGLRDYRDGGESLAGQIGAEATPREYVAALLACTREWMRVLKPTGSLFVNLGDKYSQRSATRPSSHQDGLFPGRPELQKDWKRDRAAGLARMPNQNVINDAGGWVAEKSLMGLPWRYALGCIDDLGLILRAEIVWSKANGMPESASDRTRRAHEQVFHFVRQPRYYSAVDELREPHVRQPRPNEVLGLPGGGLAGQRQIPGRSDYLAEPSKPSAFHPLGRLPGSVWEIGSQPLLVPGHLAVDHFAAFPMELPRRCVLGWSPPGICTACGEGRRPLTTREIAPDGQGRQGTIHGGDRARIGHATARKMLDGLAVRTITGYACACTPYTDHPERRGRDFHAGTDRPLQGMNDGNGGERYRRYMEELASPRGPVREYHLEDWQAPPAVPAIVLDPFGGTGTTALVADVLGRTGISVDRSADYCRLAQWRTTDPGERARAMQVPKPPAQLPGQGELDLFSEATA
jgi:DNA modification methylase